MSKKSKSSKVRPIPKPDAQTLAYTEAQLRRLEAAGWLKFAGFRKSDGFAKVEASASLVMLQMFTGYPFEVVVAGLLHSMDEMDAAAHGFKPAPGSLKIEADGDVHYV